MKAERMGSRIPKEQTILKVMMLGDTAQTVPVGKP